MGDPILGPPDSTAPRATHEFRLEEAARNQGHAHVRYRDAQTFHAVVLIPASSAIYVGRDEECAIRIQNDERVSRRHARLIFGAGLWSIEDGPSRNGTFVGVRRIVGEEILSDRSTFIVGRTMVSFHLPKSRVTATVVADSSTRLLEPTPTQHKVLVELVRPFLKDRGEVPLAPTNAAIAEMLGYQIGTIRDAISDLYHQAGLRRGETNQRVALVRMALRERAVEPKDLD